MTGKTRLEILALLFTFQVLVAAATANVKVNVVGVVDDPVSTYTRKI